MSAAVAILHDSRARELVRLTLVLTFILAVLAISLRADAAQVSDIPGAFADVGIGVAEMGAGGAAVATARGATSIFWNPAGLVGTRASKEFAVTYSEQMGLVPYSAASGAVRIGGRYVVGAGLIYSGDDVLSETTALFALARTLPGPPWAPGRGASVGLTVRTRWATFGRNESTEGQVTGSAFGGAIDVGTIVPLTRTLRFGAAGRDVLSLLKWDSSARGTYQENVPATLVFGLAARLRDGLAVEIDLDKSLYDDTDDVLLAGAELDVFSIAALRGGYRRALSPDGLEEFSVGAGVTVPAGSARVTLDAAYLIGRLENTLRLGARFSF